MAIWYLNTSTKSLFQAPPYSYVTPKGPDEYTLTGYVADIWHGLQNITGFKYSLIPCIDGPWGTKLKNGSWNGMIGMITRGEVQVAVASFLQTVLRSQVVDYSRTIRDGQ